MDSQNLNFEEDQINFYRQNEHEDALENGDQDDFNSLEEIGQNTQNLGATELAEFQAFQAYQQQYQHEQDEFE